VNNARELVTEDSTLREWRTISIAAPYVKV
jgi:hypothetical protein